MARDGHRRKRWRPDHEPDSSSCWKSRRSCRTRRGSSPARSRGTGGTPTTSTAWTSSRASTPQTYKYYIDFAAKYGLAVHHPRRRLVQARQRARSGSGNQHGGADRLRASRRTSASSCGWSGRRSTTSWSPRSISSQKWGVKGIKVDFMQRDDQLVIDFYHKVSRESREAQDAGRLSWRSEARVHDPHLAEPDQHRRRARHGMEQVERRVANPSTT